MSKSPNGADVQEQQQAPSGGPLNAFSQTGYNDGFSTVSWLEFNISAKPNYQALAADSAVQHLVGQTARAALDNIAEKVTERIVSSMRGIVEKTVKEVSDDIPRHVAASLEDIFKDHPVPLNPIAFTGFQRLSSRPSGERSVGERAAAIASAAPATDLAPALSVPAPVDEVSGEPQIPGSFAEPELNVTPGPPPPTTLSDHLPELRMRFAPTEPAGSRDTGIQVESSANETSLIEVEDTADAPPPAGVVKDSDQGVEAPPEAVQSELEKGSGGAASPSPVSAPSKDLDDEEKEAETVVGTEAKDENDSDIKATHEEADVPAVSGDNNENINQAQDSHGSIGNTGDPEAVESASAAVKNEVENEFEVLGEHATADEVDEQGSSTDFASPRMSFEPESLLVPDISSASWIWSTNNSTSQESIGSGGARVFRKVVVLPMKVDSMVIDIAFPQTGQYTIYANDVAVEKLYGAHKDDVRVQRFKANLKETAKRVVFAVSAPMEDNIAETPGSDSGEDSKTMDRAGLILAGVLWLSNPFQGHTYTIKTDISWQSAVVASGETGFTKAEYNAGWKDVTVVGSYSKEPSGGFHIKDQVRSEPEQFAEPHKQALVSEVAQEGTEGGENSGGE